jgi:hypothetical protein
MPPEEQGRGATAVSGVFGMFDDVIRINPQVSNCIVGNGSPWRVQSRDNETTG